MSSSAAVAVGEHIARMLCQMVVMVGWTTRREQSPGQGCGTKSEGFMGRQPGCLVLPV